MYATVPTIIPCCVSRERSSETARPKSPIFATPSEVSQTLPGLRSRCTMPRSCANARPRATPFAISSVRASGSGPACLLELALDVAAGEQLVDDVGRAAFFADLEDRDDVRVRAEAAHRLRLAHDALAPDIVEAVRLDQREGDVAVEARVVREEDALLAALAEEPTHLVAAGGEGGRLLGRRGCSHGGRGTRAVGPPTLGGLDERGGIGVGRIEREDGAAALLGGLPVGAAQRLLGLVEELLDAPLEAFARHDVRHGSAPAGRAVMATTQ